MLWLTVSHLLWFRSTILQSTQLHSRMHGYRQWWIHTNNEISQSIRSTAESLLRYLVRKKNSAMGKNAACLLQCTGMSTVLPVYKN